MKKQPFIIAVLFLLLVGTFSMPAAAKTAAPHKLGTPYVVNSTADTDDGVCSAANCTLREAINAANLVVGGNVITFSITGTITLSSALPTINDSAGLTITGPAGGLTISGANAYRIMYVASGAALMLGKLTLANANPASASGGAVFNLGTLTVNQCTFQNDHGLEGGAIYDDGGGKIYEEKRGKEDYCFRRRADGLSLHLKDA